MGNPVWSDAALQPRWSSGTQPAFPLLCQANWTGFFFSLKSYFLHLSHILVVFLVALFFFVRVYSDNLHPQEARTPRCPSLGFCKPIQFHFRSVFGAILHQHGGHAEQRFLLQEPNKWCRRIRLLAYGAALAHGAPRHRGSRQNSGGLWRHHGTVPEAENLTDRGWVCVLFFLI